MGERRLRESARLVILDQHNRIFLFRHQDCSGTWWVTPGGGLEPGETWEEAAMRELGEETGIVSVPLGGWIWSREKDGVIGSEPVRAVERYFLVRAEPAMVHTDNQLPYEREVYQQYRWCSVEDLRANSETAWPAGLADLLARLVSDGTPRVPIRLPDEDDT